MLRPALAALICCALISYIRGSQNTHIDNHSKWTILVTTSYLTGDSKFIKRAIPPGGSAVDTYNPKDNVNLDVQVQDAEFSNHFMVDGDTSVIAQDTPGNEYGVDFYEASKVQDYKGKPILTKEVGGKTVSALKTRIFAPGPPPAPKSPPAPASPDASPPPDGDVGSLIVFKPDLRVPATQRQAGNGDCKEAVVDSVARLEIYGTEMFEAPCTGFLANKKYLVTAAHCITMSQSKDKFDRFIAYFGSTDAKCKGVKATGSIADCNTNSNWPGKDYLKGPDYQYDYAVCSIKETLSIASETVGGTVENAKGGTVEAATIGYPTDKPKWVPYFDSCTSKPDADEGFSNQRTFVCSTYKGQSGSPLWASTDGKSFSLTNMQPKNRFVIGIISHENLKLNINSAVDLEEDSPALKDILKWIGMD